MICGSALWPAWDSAHSVVERMPVRQKASTGFGNSIIKAPKAAPCSSVTFPDSTGR